jgi:hypothetical protein
MGNRDIDNEVEVVGAISGTVLTIMMIELILWFIYAFGSVHSNEVEADAFVTRCMEEHKLSAEECKAYAEVYVELGKKDYDRLMPIIIHSITK